jgi:hypothetical protein
MLRLAMAGAFHVAVGRLVLLSMAVLLLVVKDVPVGAYEMVFSNETITDLTAGGIDVGSLITGDWLSLPLGGSCGLAAKYITLHVYNTSTTRVTLHTTFEYLTQECTAEYRHDINTCALLNSDFAVCLGFPLDSRISHSPWGYCSNQYSRVSYLWIPATTSNYSIATTNMAKSSQLRVSSSLAPPAPSVCWSHGRANETSTDPAVLAKIDKDVATLSKVESRAAIGAQSCDWRHSNIIPVAWDGVQNVLVAGESLLSPDGTYALSMQFDCNLVVYKKRADGSTEWNAKWASFSHFMDPFQHACYLELQPSGNLVVRDPEGAPRWSSNSTAPGLYSTALSVISCGNVIVLDMTSGAVIWATHTGHT